MTILLLAACGAAAVQVIPTARPTVTPTLTVTASRTPAFNVTPTISPTPIPATPTGGPSPTPLFGPTRTPASGSLTPTRVLDPNAPRIEYFTSDSVAVEPGGSLMLFWSTRGVSTATIYRLDRNGARSQLWNVPPDGSLEVSTRRSDRGSVDFVLSAGDGPLKTEQTLSVPLACPIPWFFSPPPDACPKAEAQPSALIEQEFQRGRMIYVGQNNTIYALFNDGQKPAWVAFNNRYDPLIHPEMEESFVPPPGFYQPMRVLGFVWRGSDTVRNRLGLGIDQEFSYQGFIQSVSAANDTESLYISSVNGGVLLLLPGGESWQIITSG